MINVLEDAGSHKPPPTCLALRMLKHIQSPPTWGRGLKLSTLEKMGNLGGSPPTWGRGLKQFVFKNKRADTRRPPRGGVD